MTIKAQVMQDMKTAMKAHETVRLSALRLLLAAIKQREVDDRAEATDELSVSIQISPVGGRFGSLGGL